MYRNEWKFCCPENMLSQLQIRLNSLMNLDKHSNSDGTYIVKSLYFDDIRNTCALDVQAGSSKRFKYRLRYYNNQPETLHLELKKKIYGRCKKYKCPVSIEQYEKIMNGNIWDLFWETDDKILKRFCIDMASRGFSPRLITEYKRTAYVEPVLNIRVTMDRCVSVSNDVNEFLTGNYKSFPVQRNNNQILEIKFDGLFPKFLHEIINMRCLFQTSFSKYYNGFRILTRM